MPRRPATGRPATAAGVRAAVPPATHRAGRGVFVLLVCLLLGAGLLGLLFINTLLAQGAFAMADLRARSSSLADTEQTLAQAVAGQSSPVNLEQRARALGMVRSPAPVFLRLADRKVLGTPIPAPLPKRQGTEPATGGADPAAGTATPVAAPPADTAQAAGTQAGGASAATGTAATGGTAAAGTATTGGTPTPGADAAAAPAASGVTAVDDGAKPDPVPATGARQR
ncbi:MAG: hypothetical protein EPO13_01010 [Actinomycetota bacterium]|nr:MAG: hypothetical protein EPO13_01010 [Actinomycetota bacterium]